MPKRGGDGAEGGGEVGQIEVKSVNSHSTRIRQLQLGVLVLVGVQDVGIVQQQKIAMAATSPFWSGTKSAERRYDAWRRPAIREFYYSPS